MSASFSMFRTTRINTSTFGNRIQEVPVERETETSVWVAGVRSNKHSSTHDYWPTWSDAQTHLQNRAHAQLVRARRALELAQATYAGAKGLKAPGKAEAEEVCCRTDGGRENCRGLGLDHRWAPTWERPDGPRYCTKCGEPEDD